MDAAAEPLAFVVKQRQGRDQGCNTDYHPCNRICQQSGGETPYGSNERHKRTLCQNKRGLEYLKPSNGFRNNQTNSGYHRNYRARHGEKTANRQHNQKNGFHQLLVFLYPSCGLCKNLFPPCSKGH